MESLQLSARWTKGGVRKLILANADVLYKLHSGHWQYDELRGVSISEPNEEWFGWDRGEKGEGRREKGRKESLQSLNLR